MSKASKSRSTGNQLHIANAAGLLDEHLIDIKDAYDRADKLAVELLHAESVDVIVRVAPEFTIPELGIGGFTATNGLEIYISLDPAARFKKSDLASQLLHEFHHASRFQKIGYKKSFRDALTQEGLACLLEEEIEGTKPIYAKVVLNKRDVDAAKMELKKPGKYNHERWFFGSDGVDRWFGYTYGYTVAKEYATSHKKTAAELVSVDSSKLFPL